MPTREMKHPQFEIEEADEGLRITFRITYSKFGSVEVVLGLDEVDLLVGSLEQAVVFAGVSAGGPTPEEESYDA